jgi:Raf kinase inhibitor-like YbhB/YbcL family protein
MPGRWATGTLGTGCPCILPRGGTGPCTAAPTRSTHQESEEDTMALHTPSPRAAAPSARLLLRAALCLALGASGLAQADGGKDDAERGSHHGFTLWSPDLAGPNGNAFPLVNVLNGFGCTGGNVSPELRWRNVPAGTKSLALQVHDRDAPTGAGFWHWAVYDIPATAEGLQRGAGNDPKALPGKAYGGNTDFLDTGATGVNGNYGGPCPPVGDVQHHYTFTLYALAVDSVTAAAGIPRSGSATLYSFVLNKGLGAGLLGQASFSATYAR